MTESFLRKERFLNKKKSFNRERSLNRKRFFKKEIFPNKKSNSSLKRENLSLKRDLLELSITRQILGLTTETNQPIQNRLKSLKEDLFHSNSRQGKDPLQEEPDTHQMKD
jgi:hypothetical protein